MINAKILQQNSIRAENTRRGLTPIVETDDYGDDENNALDNGRKGNIKIGQFVRG